MYEPCWAISAYHSSPSHRDKGLDIIPADKRLGKAEMEIAGKSIARERY